MVSESLEGNHVHVAWWEVLLSYEYKLPFTRSIMKFAGFKKKQLLTMNFVFIIVSNYVCMPHSMLHHRGVSYVHWMAKIKSDNMHDCLNCYYIIMQFSYSTMQVVHI